MGRTSGGEKWDSHPYVLTCQLRQVKCQIIIILKEWRRLQLVLNIWNLKGLSTLGRVLIVKSLAISRWIYLLSMLPIPSSNCMDKIKDLLYEFIWNNKKDKIKRKVMNQDHTLKGCKMINITIQNKALKLSWIPCIFENNDYFWVQCLYTNLHLKQRIETKRTWTNVWVTV